MAANPFKPKLVREGPVNDPGGPRYRFLSVSNMIDRDGEYHIPYSTTLLRPGTKLEPLKPFAAVVAVDKMEPVLGQLLGAVPPNGAPLFPPMVDPLTGQTVPGLAPFVFVDVENEGGQDWLVFGRNTPTDESTYDNPSSVSTERRTWTWPAIMLSFGMVQFDAVDGNLLNVMVNPTIQREYQGPTDFIVSTWWTAAPWPDNMMQPLGIGMIKTPVFWNYWNLASGEINCLHPKIRTPPYSGVTSVRGQLSSQSNTQGDEFAATNTPTWILDLEYDRPKQIRGRWFREQSIAIPPFDPTRQTPPRKWTS